MAAVFAVGAAMFGSSAPFGAAQADGTGKAPVVVELFTSQGCSSCPPADEFLGRIADREDIIALSLHVDYWDYLGWKDVYGLPGHSDRQRKYARHMKERMVYTPQIIVNGAEGMVGSQTALVEDAIKRHLAKPASAVVGVSLRGDRLVVEVAPSGTATAGHVVMAWYSRTENVAIGAGENTGRRITYHNVVRGWADLGEWRGSPIAMTAPKPMTADGVAVLVHDTKTGQIIGAGRLALVR
ncbi:MAG: DUF1223 domain-containing protein [Pikeienuella sp.]